jgi:hypothetical protein
VSEGAAKVAETGFWSLPDTDLKDLVALAARARAQIEAIELRLVADVAGRGVAARDGAPSAQAWLRGRLRLTPGAAAGRVRLAAALERLPVTRDALTDGRISPAHARVIAEAMAELPSDASLIPGPAGEDVDDQGSLRQRAEAHLVECATRFDPRQLRRLGHRIVEVVDPDAADAREAQKVAELEKRAYRRRELRFSDDGRGTVFLSGRLDVESAAVVRRALDPLAKPRPNADGAPDLRTAGCRLADALVEVSRRALVSGGLPVQRGERPQIVVTIDYAKLRDQVGVGLLDTGEALSRRHSAATCLRRGHRPRRAGRRLGATRPRAHRTVVQPGTTPCPDRTGQGMCVSRLRPASGVVRCAPYRPLGKRRTHRSEQLCPAVWIPSPLNTQRPLASKSIRRRIP